MCEGLCVRQFVRVVTCVWAWVHVWLNCVYVCVCVSALGVTVNYVSDEPSPFMAFIVVR
jgi:hypothetical protein